MAWGTNQLTLMEHSCAACRAEVDSALLAGIEGKDADAMRALFDRYAKRMYSVALRVLHCSEEAEDIVQEVLLQLWRDPSRYRSARGSLGSWLAVVTRNRSIDLLRKRYPMTPIDTAFLQSRADVAKDVEHRISIQRVQNAMRTLPKRQREMLLLTYSHGLTHVEIADLLKIPLGSVKTALRISVASLRVLMKG